MERLLEKWATAAELVPDPEIEEAAKPRRHGILYYGTSATPMDEALAELKRGGVELDRMRVRAFPFPAEVYRFIERHEIVFVVEQNRDAQLRTLLVNEGELDPSMLVPIRHYDGMPIPADTIVRQISDHFAAERKPRLTEVQS